MKDWFYIDNVESFDSPALVVYPDRIRNNIALAKEMIGDVQRLRPHVKTNKMSEVCTMMMEVGIIKFKCATIAEAEMLGMIHTPDVLLAYQPIGPKQQRLISLIKTYPQTLFSCLLDNEETAQQLSDVCSQNSTTLKIYIDVNIGMNRTGIRAENALTLAEKIKGLPSLHLTGFHAYDGHIHDNDFKKRKEKSDTAFQQVETLWQHASQLFSSPLTIVAGGTPTFPVHVLRKSYVECSPGTFVFWDWGYKHSLPDEPFEYAALIVTRIISIPDEQTVCVDVGHKSIAAENPLPRVHFLNVPDATHVSQSEEHLVLKVPDSKVFSIGDVWYGVPVHICPTVALYDMAYAVKDNAIIDSWNVIARNRTITI